MRIQVAGKRLVAPDTATLSIEHEVEGADEELELQLRWQTETAAVPPAKAKPAKRKAPKRRNRPSH